MARTGGDERGARLAAVSRAVFDTGETTLSFGWHEALCDAESGDDPEATADAVAIAGFCTLIVGGTPHALCDPSYREVAEVARQALDAEGEAAPLVVTGVERALGVGYPPAFALRVAAAPGRVA